MRLNDPHFGAPLFCLPDGMQEVDIGRNRMRAPNEDQIALRRFIRLRLQSFAHDRFPTVTLGGGAKRPFKAGSTQFVKQGVTGVSLQQAHGSGIGSGQDGFAAILVDDLTPTARDATYRLIPGYFPKFVGALGSGSQQRTG